MQQQGYLGFVTEMTMEFKPMNGITHHVQIFGIIMMISQTLMILISIMMAQSHTVKFCVRLNSSIQNQMNVSEF